MLWTPPAGPQALESNVGGTTAAEFGTALAAAGTAHTKTSWTQLIASTAYDSYGVVVAISQTPTASTNIRRLVDIGIGAASSEVVLLPDLNAGNTGLWNSAAATPAMYYFPVFVPAGTRISARHQSSSTTVGCTVAVWLMQWPIGPGQWVGQRVTAYGVNAANSYGTSVAQSTGGYGTTAEITASCGYPIRALQLGQDMLADTTGATKRGIVRIGRGATPDWFVSDLPFQESTTTENLFMMAPNLILSQMRFAIPAATRLTLATRTSSAESRGWIIYGVD